MAQFDGARTDRDVRTGIAAELAAAGFGDAEEVGRGGFGTVYRCFEYSLDRHVAVKAMTAEVRGDEREQFVREQRALGRMSGHPHILQVLQVDITPTGRPFIVMPFHSRGSLEHLMRTTGPFGWREVLSIGVKMAGALAAAHAIGIIHRDVKPGNILLTDYGEPQLADFGIAQFGEATTTSSHTVKGTPAYTAPEVLGGASPSAASDIYGLGATLFCLLTGHAPFARRSGEPLEEQLARIATASLPDLHSLGIPHPVCDAVTAAMSPMPADRPASALELGERFRAVQRECGLPVDVMAVPPKAESPTAAVMPGLFSGPGSVTPPPPPSTATKFRPPTAPGATIERSRLLDLIRRGGRRRLTLIHGPAGFGKTTLASQWARALAAEGVPVAWLTADPDDDNVVWFLAHVVEAIRRVRPELAQEIGAALEQRASDTARYVLSTLIDEIHDSHRAMVLVIDDWHLVTSETTVAAMDYLLEHSCHHLVVVVASRTTAGLPVSRLLMHDELVEIDVAELRFSTAEANTFLTEANSLPLSDADVSRLQESTEGWPAALQLASLTLRGRSDPGAFIDALSGRHRSIATYLTENVLDELDPAMLDFMMETAITDRISGELARALTGHDDSHELLDDICDRNLFLRRLDESGEWFHYHRLFADYLQRRLVRQHPGRLEVLHQRASTWFAEHDVLSSAVDHALAADDPDRAVELVEQHALDLMERARTATFLGLLGKLPQRNVESRPRLQLWAAWASLAIQRWDGVARALRAASAALDSGAVCNPDEAAGLRDEVALVRVGQQLLTDRYAGVPPSVAEHLADVGNPFVATSAANMASTDALLRFDFAEARRWQQRAMPLHRGHKGLFGLVHGRCYAGLAAFEQLDIDAADEMFSGAADAARRSGPNRHAARMVGALLGELRYHQGQLTEAEQLLDASAELGRQAGFVWFLLATYRIGARVKAIRGDRAAADRRLADGAEIAERYSLPRLAAAITAERIRLGLPIPDDVRARLLQLPLYRRQDNGIHADIAEFDQASVIWLLLADGSASAAEQAATRAGAMVGEIGTQPRPRAMLQARLLHACCQWAAGDHNRAETALAELIPQCTEHGLIRFVTDAGPNITDLLAAGPASLTARL
ncbi:protein kinase [Skermania sp. ID1734]|nr:protein kinase [Skermania sp. ID1734]